VIAVVWHHTGSGAFADVWILQQGHFGVDFFFAISGFLITTLLLREHRRNGAISYRKFLARRAFRIFPLFYAVLSLYVVLTLLTRRDTAEAHQFFRNLPAFATYTSNWFVDLQQGTSVTFYFAWSLATEEQFYIFWPPLLALMLAKGRDSVLTPLAAIGVLVTVNMIALHAVGGDALPVTILRSLSLPMLLGVLGALLADRAPTFRVVDRALRAMPTQVLLVAALIGELAVGVQGEIIQVTMVLLVVACCLPGRGPFDHLLQWTPLARVGVISYGVYLMHMLAANVVRPVIGREYGIAVFIGTSLVVLAAAEASFRWFETPLLRIKDRRFSSQNGPTPPRVENAATRPSRRPIGVGVVSRYVHRRPRR
jgi:peptidoglycan/LPS O-acetylase OafA/YrhL